MSTDDDDAGECSAQSAASRRDTWSLKTCCLETTHFGGHHTGVRIADKLKDVATRFAVGDKVSAVRHDQAANAELAGKS